MSLEFFPYMYSVFEANVLITFLSLLISDKLEMLRFLIMDETSLMNDASSLLFFAIKNLDKLIFSSTMGMETVRGT